MRPETASEKNHRLWRNAHLVLRQTRHPILTILWITFLSWTRP